MSMQHAGEDETGFFIEGLIKFLLSENEEAKSTLDKCDFYIIPMMNPDGFFYGTIRYNWNMADLNSNWDKLVDSINQTKKPEVIAVRKWINHFLGESSIDLFMDVHNHGQKGKANYFIYRLENFRKFAELNTTIWDVSADTGKFNDSIASYYEQRI